MKNSLKKYLSIILMCVSVLALVACGNTTSNKKDNVTADSETTLESKTSDSQTTITKQEEKTIKSESKTLVAYFSATGTTKKIAEYISTVTGGELYEIIPEQPYSSDDLNYSNSNSRSTKEQNDKNIRPAISGTVSNWDEIDVIFIGFPIWWGEEPRIIDTFVEKYNFEGKTVIPFCTSSSSGIGSSDKNMKNLSKGNATWMTGKRIDSSISHNEMCDWVNSFGLGYDAK